MARPTLHDAQRVLDAARDLALDVGPRAVGMRAIAARASAPSGSLYHLFGSRDELVACVWLRAVRRFQSGLLEALELPDPRNAVGAAAAWSYRFATEQEADCRLLLGHRLEDLLDFELQAATLTELRSVNTQLVAALRRLSARLHGSRSRRALEQTTFAVVDLPYAVVRRHLLCGTVTPTGAAALEAAAIALSRADPVPRRPA